MIKHWYSPQVMQWGSSLSQVSLPGALPTCNSKGLSVYGPAGQLSVLPSKICPPAEHPRSQLVCHTPFKAVKQPVWMAELLFKINCWIFTPAALLLDEQHPNDFLPLCLESHVWLLYHSHADVLKLPYSVVKWWSAESIKTHPNFNFLYRVIWIIGNIRLIQ